MICKKAVFFLTLMSSFCSLNTKADYFDSAGEEKITPLLTETAVGVPDIQLPPQPAVEAYGETNDGTVVKLSSIEGEKDQDFNGIRYTWIPGLKSAIFRMTCESPGNAQYTWQLRLMRLINMPERAGHDHALRENLPASATTYHAPPNLQAGASYYIDDVLWEPQLNYLGQALTKPLGPKSRVTLKIPCPKYSTSIALPLEYSGACNSAETRYMDIMVPGLVKLPANEAVYALVGAEKGKHYHYTATHYGTVETVAALKRLAHKWRATYPKSYKLAINDISLPWGGAFDLKGDWNHNSSHFNHSFGIAADISKRCVKKSERPALIKMMGEMGFTVKSSGDPYIGNDGVLKPDPDVDHYHIQYTPELNRLLDYKIPPNNIKFPITETGAMVGVNEDLEQTDVAGDVFWDFLPNKATFNCQKYMTHANSCTTPKNIEERRYCHCITLYNRLNPEPENYAGCPK